MAHTSVDDARRLFARKMDTTGSTYTVRFSAHSDRGMEYVHLNAWRMWSPSWMSTAMSMITAQVQIFLASLPSSLVSSSFAAAFSFSDMMILSH